jgi:hypothetical protein
MYKTAMSSRHVPKSMLVKAMFTFRVLFTVKLTRLSIKASILFRAFAAPVPAPFDKRGCKSSYLTL